jgi:putative acetyltransferase
MSARPLPPGLELRPIRGADDAAVARIIREVMPEFGACGPGFAINDPEVDFMSEAYAGLRAAYLVLVKDGVVVGGGGFAPLQGGDPATCELRKMYYLPAVRGQGAGRLLLDELLARAAAAGFRRMYLETLGTMHAARKLYLAAGFSKLCAPEGATGHHGCDAWYARDL